MSKGFSRETFNDKVLSDPDFALGFVEMMWQDNGDMMRENTELRAALSTLVSDLEALMEESHVQLYSGDGLLVDTSWGKLLQGGKDEYLSNWREAKRLAGGESER